MLFNGPLTKRNEEKVVVTKIYFYGSAKIEQKIKVCLMENIGFCCQDDQSEGEQLYARLQNCTFCQISWLMLMDFHKTSVTVILLMRQLK